MMRFFLMLLFLSVCVFPEESIGSCPNGDILRKESDTLLDNPQDRLSQLRYLSAFPKTYAEFIDVFDPVDFSCLYHHSSRHLTEVLPELMHRYPHFVEVILVQIAKDAKGWSPDAGSYLQKLIQNIALKNTSYFVLLLDNLSSAQRKNVLWLIVDYEAIKKNVLGTENNIISDTYKAFKKLGRNDMAELLKEMANRRVKCNGRCLFLKDKKE